MFLLPRPLIPLKGQCHEIFDLCFLSNNPTWAPDSQVKGTVQRKLTGVLSGINQKLMTCHCSDGYSFFNLKSVGPLNLNKRFSVA
jgi:hypothetical protein